MLQYALSIKLVRLDSAYDQSCVCEGAAFAGDLVKLQWLHTEQGCSMATAVSERAASSGSIAVLQWLAEVCDDTVVHTAKL